MLDDNKKLCLNSGEIISMQGLMNMIFEVQDLAVASPATVSRCGMVYMQSQLLGWRPVMLSWLATLPEAVTLEQRTELVALFDWILPPMLRFAQKEIANVLPMQEINLAASCMQLFESLLTEWRENPSVRFEPPRLRFHTARVAVPVCILQRSRRDLIRNKQP